MNQVKHTYVILSTNINMTEPNPMSMTKNEYFCRAFITEYGGCLLEINNEYYVEKCKVLININGIITDPIVGKRTAIQDFVEINITDALQEWAFIYEDIVYTIYYAIESAADARICELFNLVPGTFNVFDSHHHRIDHGGELYIMSIDNDLVHEIDDYHYSDKYTRIEVIDVLCFDQIYKFRVELELITYDVAEPDV